MMIGDGYGYGDGYGETEGPRFDDTSRAEAHRELMAIARVLAEGLGLIEDGEDRKPFLDEIRQEMKKIRKTLEDSHAASEAMRGQAQAYLEAQQAKTQEYLDQVQIEPEPDFYPFVELPAGTEPRDLPDGNRLFTLPDGMILRTTDDQRICVIDAGEQQVVAPGPGTAIEVARDVFTPWWSPICVRPRRQPVSADCLPGSSRPPWARNASRWFCPRVSVSTSITGSGSSP